MKQQQKTLFPGFAGNKVNYNIEFMRDYRVIIEPFLGGGGLLLPAMLKMPQAEIHVAEQTKATLYLLDCMLSGNLEQYKDNLIEYLTNLIEESSCWEELRTNHKNCWNLAESGNTTVPLEIGWLKTFCHSYIERTSSKGLNVSLSGEKIIGTAAWKRWGQMLIGPKPRGQKAVIAYNMELGEHLFKTEFLAPAVAKIERWYKSRLELSARLQNHMGEIFTYTNCYDIPLILDDLPKLIFNDAPYFCDKQREFTDAKTGRKRIQRMTGVYPWHEPEDWATWELCEYWMGIKTIMPNTDIIVWNYESQPYNEIIAQHRRTYPSKLINSKSVKSCVNTPSMHYRPEPMNLENGVYFSAA